eukprot:13144941-Alexandrium_andersonii.AAC.1
MTGRPGPRRERKPRDRDGHRETHLCASPRLSGLGLRRKVRASPRNPRCRNMCAALDACAVNVCVVMWATA